ncbi:unnamed protein product [Clonostachys solani]|uniref:Uncharacterized protein n=1 Tax=Clonostachys solani TaxID=160281 RepID=A0A9N9Z7B6_9HYPO|nr:unnamed protein product [Clonostachys solani]
MKFNILTVFLSVLSTVAVSTAREYRPALYERGGIYFPKRDSGQTTYRSHNGRAWVRNPEPYDYQDNCYRLGARSLNKPSRRLAGRAPPSPKRKSPAKAPGNSDAPDPRYAILIKAAGKTTFTAGKRYALLEKAKFTNINDFLHHRLVVGTYKLGGDGKPMFTDTAYYEVTKNSKEPNKGQCKISSGPWRADMAANFDVSFLGAVRQGVNVKAESDAYIGQEYSLAASVGGRGQNCQTYASGLWKRIKE